MAAPAGAAVLMKHNRPRTMRRRTDKQPVSYGMDRITLIGGGE